MFKKTRKSFLQKLKHSFNCIVRSCQRSRQSQDSQPDAGLIQLIKLFDYNPDRTLDAFGYSEDKVISFLKIIMLCNCPCISSLLALKKAQPAQDFIEFEKYNRKTRAREVYQVPLTPYLVMLMKKFATDENSEYIFPYLRHTEGEKRELQAAIPQGEIHLIRMLQHIHQKKIGQFHVLMNRRLKRLATRLNLSEQINLNKLRTTMIMHYNDPAFHKPTNPVDINETMAIAETIRLTNQEPLSFIFAGK